MTDSNDQSCENRRRFLFRATASAVVAGAIFPACSPNNMMGMDVPTGDSGPMEVDTATLASAIMVGDIKVLNLNGGTVTVVLGRDGMGYYAMDGLCTHQSCPVRFTAGDTKIGCTCNHGSTFAFDGALLSPATSGGPVPNQTGLSHLAMRIDAAGKIFVSVGSVVPNGMRYQAG